MNVRYAQVEPQPKEGRGPRLGAVGWEAQVKVNGYKTLERQDKQVCLTLPEQNEDALRRVTLGTRHKGEPESDPHTLPQLQMPQRQKTGQQRGSKRTISQRKWLTGKCQAARVTSLGLGKRGELGVENTGSRKSSRRRKYCSGDALSPPVSLRLLTALHLRIPVHF